MHGRLMSQRAATAMGKCWVNKPHHDGKCIRRTSFVYDPLPVRRGNNPHHKRSQPRSITVKTSMLFQLSTVGAMLIVSTVVGANEPTAPNKRAVPTVDIRVPGIL